MVGAAITALLFTLGKSYIGWYIGASAVASSYGATGATLVVLLWVYYSSEVFLLGAEFTRAWSIRHGSRTDLRPVMTESEDAAPSHAAANPAQTQCLLLLLGAFIIGAIVGLNPSR